MFKKILLATDGSPQAQAVIKYARELALRDDARLIVVHAFPSIPAYLGEPWRDQFIESHTQEARRITEEAAAGLRDAGIDVDVVVLEGPAANAILHVAEERECDLIVMGHRGEGEYTSLMLGSVAHRVLAHAHVPVLVVRAQQGEPARDRDAAGTE
jgi:nucleotide-binding universal stress UspA family protein